MRETKTACNIFGGKPERKRPLGGHKYRWKIMFKKTPKK
jgi:hypothetical protein